MSVVLKDCFMVVKQPNMFLLGHFFPQLACFVLHTHPEVFTISRGLLQNWNEPRCKKEGPLLGDVCKTNPDS